MELRHFGEGVYEAYDMRNAGTIAVSPAVDSFTWPLAQCCNPMNGSYSA